jgi:hypothetical protein
MNPTSNDIDQVHQEYTQAIEQLYEENKNNYGLGYVELEII